MTDLEMTKLCAEAMGTPPWVVGDQDPDSEWYWPLRHDRQAMALVKRFGLDIFAPEECDEGWGVTCQGDSVTRHFPNAPHGFSVTRPDLNRAIVECVAKMAKTPSSLSTSTPEGIPESP
jgi:hypothetical protein